MSGYLKFVLCSLGLVLVATTKLYSAEQYTAPSSAINDPRVLVITSYGSDYNWSNVLIDGFNSALDKSVNIDINVEYLTSEIYVNPESWINKMQIILDNYANNKPSLILLVSDEAWMGYMGADRAGYDDVPVVLAAVKPLYIDIKKYTTIRDIQLSDFSSTSELIASMDNVTGILREVNIDGNLRLMQTMMPDMKEVAIITDGRFYGIYSQLLARKALKQYPNLSARYFDARQLSTDSLLKQMYKFQRTTGVMLSSWLTEQHGYEFSKDFLYKRMHAILQTPIFITNDIGMEKNYFIGGYLINSSYWGIEAAKIAMQILCGQSPAEIPVVTTMSQTPVIDYVSMSEFDFSPDDLPLGTTIINKPESIFELYKVEISITAIFMLVIILSLAVVARAYVRLRSAQRDIIRLNAQTQQANAELMVSRKQSEMALDKALEADRMKSAFLANMSHEIRTPLNAIVGFSDIICSEYPDRTDLAQYYNIIAENNTLLLQLINDILDISSIESGSYTCRFSSFNLAGVVHQLTTSFQHKTKPGVAIISEIPDMEYNITTDNKLLQQIYSNFISNAVKFTDSGSITIGFKAHKDGGTYIYVRDTGCGIAAEKLECIFDRFMKVNEFVQGTGLGLTICKEIIEYIGGEIGAQSTLNKGTTFWAIIPPH